MKGITLKSLALGALIGFLALGCSQDPLKKYPDSVKNGVPPAEKAPKPDRNPLPQEGYRIDVDDILEFTEGQELEKEINVRVFVKLSSFELQVTNLATFEGATLEKVSETPTEKKYKFKWKPAEGTTGALTMVARPLQLLLMADGDVQTVREKNIKVVINHLFQVPEVVSVAFSAREVFENGKADLKVQVKDLDGTDTEPPRLRFNKPSYGSDASSYLFSVDVKKVSAGVWQFSYELDLTDREVTTDEVTFYVSTSAVSHFGLTSQSKDTSIRVKSVLREPLVSLASPTSFTFQKGLKNSVNFTVFDPYKEGEVSAKILTNTSTWPGTVALDCSIVESYLNNCELSWDIPAAATPAANYTIEIESKNKAGGGWYGGQTKTVKTTLKISIPKPAEPVGGPADGGTPAGGGNTPNPNGGQ